MRNSFDIKDSQDFINRIQQLNSNTQALWGKMNVAQMLAHCNVAYELVYEPKHSKPKGFKKWMLKKFVKNYVVSEKPYKKNTQTAPEFLIQTEKDFEAEKNRLIAFVQKTQSLGSAYFEGKESHSFGPLTTQEWNNLFSKHLNHHLTQFGV